MKILYVTGFIVVVDQISKLLVKGFSLPFLGLYHEGYLLGTSFPVLGNLLRFTYIENAGIAFGIDVGGKLFLTIFTLGATLGILWYIFKVRHEPVIIRLPLAMILGGAIGNLIDRVFYGLIYGEAALFYGRVVDFVDVDFFDISLFGFQMTRWPVFNVADAAVSTGVILLFLFHRKMTPVPSENNAVVELKTPPSGTDNS